MATTSIRATVFYVGQGMCNLVEVLDGTTVTHLLLIDLGCDADPVSARAATLPKLVAKITAHGSIDILVVSHSDADHWNLLEELFKELKKVQAKKWITETLTGVGIWDSPAKVAFETLLHANSQAWIWFPACYSNIETNGHLSVFRKLGDMEIIIPAASVIRADVAGYRSLRVEANTASIIVQCRLNKFYFLFTADATAITLKYMNDKLGAYMLGPGKGMLMTSPHHGAIATLNGSLEQLLDFTRRVTPMNTVASAEFVSTFKHPNACVMAAMSGYVETRTSANQCVINFANTALCTTNAIYKILDAGRHAGPKDDWYNVTTKKGIDTTLSSLVTYCENTYEIDAASVSNADPDKPVVQETRATQTTTGVTLVLYATEETDFFVGTAPASATPQPPPFIPPMRLRRARPVEDD